jgi:hypothetical protein
MTLYDETLYSEWRQISSAIVVIIWRIVGGSAQALIIKHAERPDDHWSGHLAPQQRLARRGGRRAQNEGGCAQAKHQIVTNVNDCLTRAAAPVSE